MKSLKRMGVLLSLLLGGVLSALLTPLLAHALTVTIDGVAVSIATTSGACTSGYNLCAFIPPKTYGKWIVGDASSSNKARIMIGDNSTIGSLDLLKLTGITFTPVDQSRTTTKTTRVVVTHTYNAGGGNPTGNYSWGYGMAGYLDPPSTENIVGDQLQQTGQGNFAGKIAPLGLGLDTGKLVTPSTNSLNGSVTKSRAAVVVMSSCNTGNAKCAPTITQTFTLTVVGADKLVLSDSLIAAGSTCQPVQPGITIPSNLHALMRRLDPQAPTDPNELSEWQIRMGEKHAENLQQKKLLTFVLRELGTWLAATQPGSCPLVQHQINQAVSQDMQAEQAEIERLRATGIPFEIAKPGAGTPVVSFTGLGDIPGGPFSSSAKDLSSDGAVVVGRGWSTSDPEASRWTMDSTGMVSLSPGVFSQSEAASSDGEVVVGWRYNLDTTPPTLRAFRWTAGTGLRNLGTLSAVPPGFSDSSATDVSADGTLVVGVSNRDVEGGTTTIEAFRWTEASGMVGLGTLPGAPFLESRATAVSADGSVIVGMAVNSSGLTELVQWKATSGYSIQGLGIVNVQATAVSGNGLVIVGSISNGLLTDAFRWSPAAGLEILPGLAGVTSGDRSIANDVSVDGAIIVGRAMNSFGDPHAVIWRKDNSGAWTIRLLKDDVLDADLWQLHEAHGISPDGRTIVGDGFSLADQGIGAWKIQFP